MAADLLSALHDHYVASGGVDGLSRVWVGAASDLAPQPFAVLRVYSSRREITTTEKESFSTIVLAETYAGSVEVASSLGDALADIILSASPAWDGGAGTRPQREGEPNCVRDNRRSSRGEETWYQTRRFLVHAIEDR